MLNILEVGRYPLPLPISISFTAALFGLLKVVNDVNSMLFLNYRFGLVEM